MLILSSYTKRTGFLLSRTGGHWSREDRERRKLEKTSSVSILLHTNRERKKTRRFSSLPIIRMSTLILYLHKRKNTSLHLFVSDFTETKYTRVSTLFPKPAYQNTRSPSLSLPLWEEKLLIFSMFWSTTPQSRRELLTTVLGTISRPHPSCSPVLHFFFLFFSCKPNHFLSRTEGIHSSRAKDDKRWTNKLPCSYVTYEAEGALQPPSTTTDILYRSKAPSITSFPIHM